MDEVPVTGEIVAAPAEEMRYEDENPDAVARVLVRVEYADGRIREYDAKEPQDFQMNDPESMSSMAFRKTRLSLPAGGGFWPLTAAVSSLRLSFTAHPRHNLHIRTERTASGGSGEAPPTQQGHVVRPPVLPATPSPSPSEGPRRPTA